MIVLKSCIVITDLFDLGSVFQTSAPCFLKDFSPKFTEFTLGLSTIESSPKSYGHFGVKYSIQIYEIDFCDTAVHFYGKITE